MAKEFDKINFSIGDRRSLDALIINKQEEQMEGRAPKKYTPMLRVLNAASNLTIAGFKRGRGIVPGLQTAYHFGRMLDDIADGDRKLPQNFASFPQLIKHLKKSLTADSLVCSAEEVEFLLKIAVGNLTKREKHPGEVHVQAIRFLDAMLFDFERRQNHLVLSQAELTRVYDETFGAPTNLTLITLGSANRAEQLTELNQAQGRTFAVKDLKQDIEMGICNIPSEVLGMSGLNFEQLRKNPKAAYENSVLQRWMTSEMAYTSTLVSQLYKKNLDLKAKTLTWFLSLGVTRKYKPQ